MNKIENPFLIYGYESPEYFCDRKEETKSLVAALKNGCNITLKSPRRYGKTGLIHNAFHFLRKEEPDVKCFYVDIYATKSLSDFVMMLGKAVVGQLDSPMQKAENYVSKFFRSCQITMSPDLATGMPQFGLSFMPQYAERTLKEIFDYIEDSGKPCFIAIDEFQQIAEYPEKNVEALLRTHIQITHNVHFVFAGSKIHMMSEMFDSPKHPFYRSTEKLNLNVLNEDTYYDFVCSKLGQKGFVLPREVFHEIYQNVDGVTWYIQSIMNHIYRLEGREITSELCYSVINKILLTEEEDFKRLYHLLTANQARLLVAIAKERIVGEPTSGLFLRTYHIKSPSSVQRSLQYLLDNEYVYKSDTGYIVYDRFFGMWMRNTFY